MRTAFLTAVMLVCLLACKSHKADVSGNEKISAEDFLSVFKDIKLPVIIADTALKNIGDTIAISHTVFNQFVPDTALHGFYGEGKSSQDVIIHPAGRINNKERNFLLATFTSAKQIKLGVFVLNNKHVFLSSLLLLSNNENNNYNHSASITTEPTFIKKRERVTADNKSLYSRIGFAFDVPSNSFMEILHDSNEDTAARTIINPIDTFPSANKFSGDFIADAKNFISVRDGKNAYTYYFFIHFEKDHGNCTGELKGTMTITNEKNGTAVFSEKGDPCLINFKFTPSSIQVKEAGNCGNHRGITCPFDFTFKKKKPAKKPGASSKK